MKTLGSAKLKATAFAISTLGIMTACAAPADEPALSDESEAASTSSSLGFQAPDVTIDWSNVVLKGGCSYLSGPNHLGQEFALGTKGSVSFGRRLALNVAFDDGPVFVGKLSSTGGALGTTLTRSPVTCPLWGSNFGFNETISGTFSIPNLSGPRLTGKYTYRECEVAADGSCVDDGCTIDADVVIRPRLKTDVDEATFTVPTDECDRYCAHQEAVLTATQCADTRWLTGSACLTSCGRRFTGISLKAAKEGFDLTECQIGIEPTAYTCINTATGQVDPAGNVVGFPPTCNNAQAIYNAVRTKGNPAGTCVAN